MPDKPKRPTPPSQQPNPGSDAALDRGCTCPVMDNGHGRGSLYGKDVFIMSESCPLHGGLLPKTPGRKPKK